MNQLDNKISDDLVKTGSVILITSVLGQIAKNFNEFFVKADTYEFSSKKEHI